MRAQFVLRDFYKYHPSPSGQNRFAGSDFPAGAEFTNYKAGAVRESDARKIMETAAQTQNVKNNQR